MSNTSNFYSRVKITLKKATIVFFVAATTLTACKKTVQEPAVTPVIPIAGFTHTTMPSTFAVTFTDTSVNAVSRRWDFGDTAVRTDTSTLKEVTYTYTNKGPFEVKLVVFSATGNEASVIKKINLSGGMSN